MSDASTLLALYRDAEIKILSGQSVRMGDRSLDMADLKTVQDERRRLEAKVARENGTGGFKAASFN